MKADIKDLRTMFEISPRGFDKVPTLVTDDAPVLREERLSTAALLRLFDERACAIHVPAFCPVDVAEQAADRMRRTARITRWRVPVKDGQFISTDMNYGIGMPYQIGMSSPENREKYYAQALDGVHAVRKAFLPFLSPIDRLRLELDEQWSPGVRTPQDDKGRRGQTGLVRIMTPDALLDGIAKTVGVCHIDDQRLPGRPRVFSANLYLKVPRGGGELKLWNVTPACPENRSNPLYQLIDQFAFVRGSQEILNERLPPPLVVHPRPGDLVILDSGRPHAVAGFKKGYRLSIQCFVNYQAPEAPVSLFS
jgi:hypothetical protein